MSEIDPIAAAVRAAMEAQEMTVAELARRTDICRVDVHRWLSGQRSIRVVLACRIMDELGLEVRPIKRAKR